MNPFTAVDVIGNAFEVGRAHALATLHVADDVVKWVEDAVRERPLTDSATRKKLTAIERTLADNSPDTLAQIEGMAEVYHLKPEEMLSAVLASFFDSSARAGEKHADQGCSTFALTGNPDDGILVKNRDTNPRYLHMQTLLAVHPPTGYAWTALSTAGAPGVHSAGMNTAGLAVADTHVPSSDIGPGLPRFSLMMNMLNLCSTVEEAIEYSSTVPVMGFGNIILSDAVGDCAVIECGFAALGIVRPDQGVVVATNHFVTPQLADACLSSATSASGVDSRLRYSELTHALKEEPALDARAHPVELMSRHREGGPGSICAHKVDGSSTIATVIFRPTQMTIEIGLGNPCTAEFFESTLA